MSGGLELQRVQVRVDGTLIVDGVTVAIPPGSVCAMIGPNGAGKTTLLHTIAAVQRPAEGTISFDSRELHRLARGERARMVSLVEQDASTELALEVHDVVALGRIPHQGMWRDTTVEDDEIISDALRTVGMEGFARRVFTSLSGGERQRVLLAKALAQQPSLLLLDEPTNHLDISAGLSTLAWLRGLTGSGVSVLAVLHDLNLALAASDYIVVMRAGRVVAFGPTEHTLSAELISEVYGVRADLLAHPATGRPMVAFSLR